VADEKESLLPRTALNLLKISGDTAVKVVVFAGLVVPLALMFPRGEAIELDYKVGSVWARSDLIAPFAFPVFREASEVGADLRLAREGATRVYLRRENAAEEQAANLDTVMNALVRAVESGAATRGRTGPARADTSGPGQVLHAAGLRFAEREWDLIARLARGGGLRLIRVVISRTLGEILQVGVLETTRDSLRSGDVAIRVGSVEEILPADRFHDIPAAIALLETRLHGALRGDNDTSALAYKIAAAVFRPNLPFDPAATALALRAAEEAVPRTVGFVEENERIVSKHERITPDVKLKLDSLRKARAERGPESAGATQLLGTAIHVGIVVMLYGIYLYLFRKRIYENNLRLALIALLILFVGALALITRELTVEAPLEYLILLPTASMLLTIIFDSRVAFYGTVVMAFLVAGIWGNDYAVALSSLVAGALSVYTVRDMKNRTQIFRSLLFIFVGYALTILALALERFDTAADVAGRLPFALANAVISPVLTYGLLIFIERVFRVTTDLTLIELAQFNHPLLRQLSERAPGTYHHSMTMASLAEAAAAAVGANEVLARVGAYFHDIGKIRKPTYFVENQKTSRNRHDRLAPRMSSLIIAAHVKDGIALAREHRLPEEIVDFIPMHHGTTRMEYFYTKALRVAEESTDETKLDEIKEADYRYPGPKPQTRETGILMLADAVEASARTLEDPSPQKLEALIDDIIRKRFAEGELDECPLTLTDLTKIKTAFLGVLVGIYHSRIRYPEPQELPAAP
jgi:putative nucleotidyltransferase with HDIG domain